MRRAGRRQLRESPTTCLGYKGQRVVAIEITLDHWALRRTRRDGAAEAWSVLPTGQAGVQPACCKLPEACSPRVFASSSCSPYRGACRACMVFSVPKHGKYRSRKAAIRWLITASDFGGFERIAWERQRVADAIYRQPAKTLKPQGLRETPHRHAHSEAVAALELRVVGSKVGCSGVAWPNFCSNQCQSSVASCTGAVAAVSKKGTGPLSKRGQVPFFTVAR